ncbi:helix-turn-helix domain-containing protein [Cohnella massiliensis]|uniref:helix-turn-helix domain-containing protein n=1 Tax=Cohnella massiliensis TaxID=1816691 RepID=UPI0009B9F001|nr:helix-turn-helix transcriptional regulator [Cohnella massiliensis]
MSQKDLLKPIIAKTLKKLRKQQRMSQEDLAGACEVDRAYISMIEVGKYEPSMTKIFELCSALKIKPSQFVQLLESEIEKQNPKGRE